MMSGHVRHGLTVGNGATLNVELGFVPVFVMLFNMEDGDLITTAQLRWVVPFSGGGTTEVAAGARIKGATSNATAIVQEVLLYSGTWAGGNAAGYFVVQEGSLTGTFQAENIFIDSDETSGSDDATVTANVVHNIAIAAAATKVLAGTSAISRLDGTAGTSGKGFTIGSVIAEEAKLLFYIAFQGD
jgi:hypothetical protein